MMRTVGFVLALMLSVFLVGDVYAGQKDCGAADPIAGVGPGPNGCNTYGLCNAYSHNGQNGNGQPFAALENLACDPDNQCSDASDCECDPSNNNVMDGDPANDQTCNDTREQCALLWCADNAEHPSPKK